MYVTGAEWSLSSGEFSGFRIVAELFASTTTIRPDFASEIAKYGTTSLAEIILSHYN